MKLEKIIDYYITTSILVAGVYLAYQIYQVYQIYQEESKKIDLEEYYGENLFI
ncbi:hypothetical protein LCGC14_1948980 [marine sediment metagenome]|uniref:Uncharacterized protein n=1 Tax=marine sediment metagenome TaxID=412755 RepID=A0A0F9HWD6_9ZZZZ